MARGKAKEGYGWAKREKICTDVIYATESNSNGPMLVKSILTSLKIRTLYIQKSHD